MAGKRERVVLGALLLVTVTGCGAQGKSADFFAESGNGSHWQLWLAPGGHTLFLRRGPETYSRCGDLVTCHLHSSRHYLHRYMFRLNAKAPRSWAQLATDDGLPKEDIERAVRHAHAAGKPGWVKTLERRAH